MNKYQIREQNENIVLENIIAEKTISRAALSQLTGLNKATISEIVKKLIDDQLVHEVGTGVSTTAGGRKPILLQFNKEAGLSLSIDIGYDSISSLLTYLDGTIIEERREDNLYINKETVVEYVQHLVANYQSYTRHIPYGITGVTLAIHGIVHHNNILFTPYYDLDQINLHQLLSQKLEMPVYLENEANLTACAENTFSTDLPNIVSISIHSGVGAGIILNEQLYHGRDGHSGEIGHTILMPNGRQCPCGNHGCLEQYCSEKAILETFKKLTNKNEATLDDLIQEIQSNNPEVKSLIEEITEYWAIGINNVISLYSPDLVYLNSPLIQAVPSLIPKVKKKITNTFNQYVPIIKSEIGGRASLLGGIALNIQQFLNIDKLVLLDKHQY